MFLSQLFSIYLTVVKKNCFWRVKSSVKRLLACFRLAYFYMQAIMPNRNQLGV